ncbi:MAG: HNH endonuclease [Actinomycetota bacterium]|nr:HNH endonuclease [Actinomycetota bacterium]
MTPRQVRRTALTVELRPGVADALVSLAGLLRPLLELHWTRAVARLNGTELGEDRLREFLFGASRVSLQRLRPGLTDLQDGRCFYCGTRLRPGSTDVDHVVPWSRVPNDALANLFLNGVLLEAPDDNAFDLVMRSASGQTDVKEIAAALRHWCR